MIAQRQPWDDGYDRAIVSLGIIFPPDQPPERLREVAEAADAAGIAELWLWEDCFAESGIAAAVAALAWTQRVRVGIGLMPVPLRNVALTAMEVATIGRLFPGRFLAGIGHGILDWMAQVDARAESPLTLLDEYAGALNRLLAGDAVTTTGAAVRLDDVRLRWPPAIVPPLYIGARKERTLALVARHGAGLVFDGGDPQRLVESLDLVSSQRAELGIDVPMTVVSFLAVSADISVATLATNVADHAAAGATSVAVFAVTSAGGPPDGSARILELVAKIAAVASA